MGRVVVCGSLAAAGKALIERMQLSIAQRHGVSSYLASTLWGTMEWFSTIMGCALSGGAPAAQGRREGGAVQTQPPQQPAAH